MYYSLVEKKRGKQHFTLSIQPAVLMRTNLFSCLDHLQNGCEAMADRLMIFMPHELHEQSQRTFTILQQIGNLSSDGTKKRTVRNVIKLIANSLSAAKVAPMEMVQEAGLYKPAFFNRQQR